MMIKIPNLKLRERVSNACGFKVFKILFLCLAIFLVAKFFIIGDIPKTEASPV